jgi:hypothetical protein
MPKAAPAKQPAEPIRRKEPAKPVAARPEKPKDTLETFVEKQAGVSEPGFKKFVADEFVKEQPEAPATPKPVETVSAPPVVAEIQPASPAPAIEEKLESLAGSIKETRQTIEDLQANQRSEMTKRFEEIYH